MLLLGVLGGAGASSPRPTRSALEIFRRAPPDVIVSDIGMPAEDGYALLRAIRALPPASGGTLPALAVTAYAREEDRLRAIG